MSLYLDDLRRIAEAADEAERPWEWEHAYPQRVTRVGDVVLVAECFENPDMPSRFAEFIAAFDPPTVLALLDIAEAVRPLAGKPGHIYAQIADLLAHLDASAGRIWGPERRRHDPV